MGYLQIWSTVADSTDCSPYFGSGWLSCLTPCGELASWKAPSSSIREWRCLEKYFGRWFQNPKVQDNQSTEQDTRAKPERSVLSIILTSCPVLHSISITSRMGPVWALPELQLDCTQVTLPWGRDTSRFEIPHPRLRDPSLPKAERSLTRDRSLVSDW